MKKNTLDKGGLRLVFSFTTFNFVFFVNLSGRQYLAVPYISTTNIKISLKWLERQ